MTRSPTAAGVETAGRACDPIVPAVLQEDQGHGAAGELWNAYRTLFAMNNAMLRLVCAAAGVRALAYDALSKAVTRLADDKEFREESMKVMEFIPEYETEPDMSQQNPPCWSPRPRCATTPTTTCATFRNAKCVLRLYELENVCRKHCSFPSPECSHAASCRASQRKSALPTCVLNVRSRVNRDRGGGRALPHVPAAASGPPSFEARRVMVQDAMTVV